MSALYPGSELGRTPRSAVEPDTREAAAGPVEVVVVRLDETCAPAPDASALLSPDERQRAARFVFDRDRRRFILARAWLRRLLAERTGTPPDSLELTYGRHGKLALAPGRPGSDLAFNLSHCQALAVFAFARGLEVGVDVEAVRAVPDADDLAARFFSPGECDAYRALSPSDRPAGFFNCWTRKEAFIKALGTGLSFPLNRFDVSLAPGEPARFIRIDDTPGERCGWALHSFSPAEGFVAALAAAAPAGTRGPDVIVRGFAPTGMPS